VRITVIGPGRAGTAIHEAARAAGIDCALTRIAADAAGADVAIIAVPDAAVAEVVAQVPPGPAVGMLSGSVPLAVLGDRARAFCLHPMQTIQPGGGPQLAGAAAGITATDAAGLALAADLARALGMHTVEVPEAARPLPHIACVFASNLLLPALAAAMRTLDLAGLGDARADLLGPLAHRAVDNALADGAAVRPTGPVARGDAATVVAHRERLALADPALERAYVLLSEALVPLVGDAEGRRAAAALGGAA
jgi:predicted short-subunit dehydrogenase-like oxidoreductase (DUF2520 family)